MFYVEDFLAKHLALLPMEKTLLRKIYGTTCLSLSKTPKLLSFLVKM